MQFEDAKATSLLFLQLGAVVNAHLASLQPRLSTTEFDRYRHLYAQAMGSFLDVFNAVHAEYPELKPTMLGGIGPDVSKDLDRAIALLEKA